jgi:hypothetical protein
MNNITEQYRAWLVTQNLDSTTRLNNEGDIVWLKPGPDLENSNWVIIEDITHDQVDVIRAAHGCYYLQNTEPCEDCFRIAMQMYPKGT